MPACFLMTTSLSGEVDARLEVNLVAKEIHLLPSSAEGP